MHLHNHVQLIGRAGHDPQLLTLTDGTLRASLRLYLRPSSTSDNLSLGCSNHAYRLVAWNSLAARLDERVKRGDTVLVQGRLMNRTRQVGEHTHIRTEIHLTEFRLLGSRSLTRSAGLAAEAAAPNYGLHE